jgi:hypothetical protein
MQLQALIRPRVPNINLNLHVDHKPEVFISYQWEKQKQIISLFEKFKSFKIKCWLDIHEMGGGDSLYEKIDNGIRNCSVVISCVI